MRKILLTLMTLLLVTGLLTACTEQPKPTEPTEPIMEEPTLPPYVELGGSQVDVTATKLDLSAMEYDWNQLLAGAERLTAIVEIELGTTDVAIEQIGDLQAAFPNASIHYSVDVLGQSVDMLATELDLSNITPEQTDELLTVLPMLSQLHEINFVSPEGVCAFSIEDIVQLDRIKATVPEVKLRVSFELFGQTVTSEDTRIEYYLVPIGNEGVETVRAVLPYLTACEYLLMDGCEVDNEVMAQLRDDFLEIKVVWRVWLIEPRYDSPKYLRCASFLTDTKRIRTVNINDSNSYVLKYCTETKYVDFGHNTAISDFSFLGYMPELEVAIIALTSCNDISVLANCPELEYLEIYRTEVTDLSPLASCTKLKHLNISRMNIDDITCLYGLELERLRCVVTDVPKEQLEEYARLHPNCEMLLEGWAPHENGWRYDKNNEKVPRYKLLQEQMEYAIDAKYGIK